MIMKRSITITYDGVDYRVPCPEKGELGCRYEDTRNDAMETAWHMYRNWRMKIHFRHVNEHPEG